MLNIIKGIDDSKSLQVVGIWGDISSSGDKGLRTIESEFEFQRLEAAWGLLEVFSEGSYCQLITMVRFSFIE